MGHTTAAATGLVDRLENLGHVQRSMRPTIAARSWCRSRILGRAIVTEVRDDMVNNLLKMMARLDAR